MKTFKDKKEITRVDLHQALAALYNFIHPTAGGGYAISSDHHKELKYVGDLVRLLNVPNLNEGDNPELEKAEELWGELDHALQEGVHFPTTVKIKLMDTLQGCLLIAEELGIASHI